MVIINDELGLLNLNPLAIFLMLTPDEIARYADKLKGLNRNTRVTKGVFHFFVIEKGNSPFKKLSEKINYSMRHYNVMVRLVNSIHGIFCYGMEEINLEEDTDSIVKELIAFVRNVCNQNIGNLSILSNRSSLESIEAMRYYEEEQIERIMTEALEGNEKVKARGKLALRRVLDCPDTKTSLGIVKFAVSSNDKLLDAKIEKELCQSFKPDRIPFIQITVKNVPSGQFWGNGEEKKKLGVELNIDGNIVPVYFAASDPAILYIITLMAITEGHAFYRLMRHNYLIKPWLEKCYRALLFNKRFDQWFNNMNDNPHNLDVAMTRIKKTLWEKLGEKYKDAYYYCILNNINGEYKMQIDKNNIKIDPSILARIG